MKKLTLLLLVAVMACASNDDEDRGPRNFPPAEGTRITAASSLLELMPPDDWWHDPQVQIAVNLTNDQMKALDEIGTKQQPDVARLRQNSREVIRDLRSAIEIEHPQSADVIAAGERVRRVRDELFDHELRLLDAERQVLTKDQWSKLESALQERRSERRRSGYPGGYGGRRGGRGRWPGM